MSEQDKEAAAIAAVINALVGLDEAGCQRVLDYAARRFAPQATYRATPAPREEQAIAPDASLQHAPTPSGRQTDIKALKDEKQPTNSIQMAVVVAYYLKELAPAEERQESISTAEVTKYFNQARFPLPTGKNGLGDTLNNARRAGYLETASTGRFRLTPVGFNLAAYNLPVSAAAKSAAKKPAK